MNLRRDFKYFCAVIVCLGVFSTPALAQQTKETAASSQETPQAVSSSPPTAVKEAKNAPETAQKSRETAEQTAAPKEPAQVSDKTQPSAPPSSDGQASGTEPGSGSQTQQTEPKEKLGPGAAPQAGEEGKIAVSEEQPQNIVSDIEVRGNQIVSSGTILNKIKIRRGDPLKQAVINEDIKRLYASGFFQDIKVDVVKDAPGQFRLTFTVDEKPIVRQIIIEGNKSISESKVRKEIKLIEGQILDPKVVKEGVVAIRTLYQNKGFKFAEIKSETDVNDRTKEAVLYILVDEGEKSRIRAVRFEGNKALKSGKLSGLMRTKARNLLLLRSGVFHEDHFENDLEKIRTAYQRAGYADVRVEPRFDYDPKTRQMTITVQVEEGQIYHAGDVRIQGNILFPESEIWEELSMLPGDVYSQFALNDDLAAVQKFYFYQGYLGAQAEPEVKFNRDTGKVDILYSIREGDLFFVNKVKIRGNTKTKDMVIRRELRIRPGEKFDGKKIETSKERLDNLGYFEETSYEPEEPADADQPNKRDLIFKVKEKQTGQLSFGGGVSSVETLIGFAEISQNNFDLFNWPTFTGAGQKISLTGRIGTRSRDIDFSFTEPYILNKPYSYNIQLYDTFREWQNTPWHDETLGASNTFGHNFTDHLSASVGLIAERVKLSDVDDTVSSEVLKKGSTFALFKARPMLAYDTRNNQFNPSRGHLFTFTPELTAGDEAYFSFFLNFTKYFTLFKTHVLESRTRFGWLSGGDYIPVFDRYFAGGLGTVRGFGYRRIGPQLNGEPIGGNDLFVQNFEYSFPIISNFKGVFFLDIGRVGKAKNSDSDSGKIGAAVGPGLKINTPIGPMVFYYGYPVANADEKDKNGRFDFSIARGF